MIGRLYQGQKQEHGGDRKSVKCEDEISSCQNDNLIPDTTDAEGEGSNAEKKPSDKTADLIAKQYGISPSTVIRYAKQVEKADEIRKAKRVKTVDELTPGMGHAETKGNRFVALRRRVLPCANVEPGKVVPQAPR